MISTEMKYRKFTEQKLEYPINQPFYFNPKQKFSKMILKCINTDGADPRAGLIVGTEYELKQSWLGSNIYTVNDYFVYLRNFESLNDLFYRLIQKANKFHISKPERGVTVDLLLTENYIVIYSHSRGNHWNIYGNHYKYYHCNRTGEFIPEHQANTTDKPLIKERFLMARFNRAKQLLIKPNPQIQTLF